MSGQEQQIQRKQQAFSVSQQQRDMQMMKEDRQMIAQYQQGMQRDFQVSSKKTLARNFRDYEIYKSLQVQAVSTYGMYQEAAEFIADTYTQIDGQDVKERMNLPGIHLSGRDALLHLCSTRMLEKEVSAETLKALSAHLTAGQLRREGETSRPAMDREMNKAGLECLKEIYFTHLSAMDKKYGDKLAGLTPSQYLKAMPALEADLTVVMDMKRFFAEYHPADEADERFVLMKKKLDFYAGAWELLQERARVYMNMAPDQVTEKGELRKDVSEDFVKKLRALKSGAKAGGAFKSWRKRTPSPDSFLEKTNERKAVSQLSEDEQANVQQSLLAKENMDTVLTKIEGLSVSLMEFMESGPNEQLTERYMEQLPDACKQLELIKCIRDYKEQRPDLYRLGQSFKDYKNCEHLLKRLPLLEELVSLTQRINHLDQYGKTVEEKTTRSELAQRREQVRQTYSNLYKNQASVSEEELKKQLSDEIASGRTRLRETREYLLGQEDPQLAVLTEEELRSDESNLALFFVEIPADPAQATAEERATLQRDLQRIKCLMDASEDPQAIGEQKEAVLTMLHRFYGRYDQVMQALQQAAFRDHAIIDQRAQLEQCMLMSQFLSHVFKGSGLIEKLGPVLQGAEYAMDLTLIRELDERMNKIQALYLTAQGLAMKHVRRNGLTSIGFLNEFGQERELTSDQDLRDHLDFYAMSVGGAVEQMRVSYMEEQHREELQALELRTRVQNAVGREMLSSAKKGTKTKEWNTVSWLGHMAGKPLQLLGWLLRDKRKNHGEDNYDKAKAAYLKKLAPIGGALLNDWQRGDATFAPAVELKKYFGSPLKQSIRTRIREVNGSKDNYEFTDAKFARAMEAMEYYASIEGIVNSDTTEMEMTFLDTFIKRAKEYLENREGVDEAKTNASRALVMDLLERVNQNLGGTLADTISKEEFDMINANTVAYIEDTTYTANMEESNIKDIPLFLHEPNINDVRQSTIGDCWLVSAISSVVNTNPDFIRSMFQDLGDGNVLVRMYEAVDHTGMRLQSNDRLYESGVTMRPVYFKLRKHYETGWGNACDCPWVQLVEKAYALGGFSDHNEMEVRGNRLYNVSDELTLGEIHLGLAHLTGHIQGEFDREDDLPKEQFLDESVMRGMLAGFSGDAYNVLEEILRDYRSSYNEQINQQTPDAPPAAYENIREGLKNPFLVNMLVRAWKEAHNEEMTEMPTEQEVEQAVDYYWEKLNANLTRMKNGERLPFTPGQQRQKDAELVEENGQTPLERRRLITNYYAMADQYEGPVKHTILSFKQCIEKGGTISLSIPHCVNVIDVKEHNGKYFFLMRDPFNIYNTEYTRDKKGNVTGESDGLTQVFTKHTANRHLMDSLEETVRGGFRGTSWIEAKELYGMIEAAFLVTKQGTQIPDHH